MFELLNEKGKARRGRLTTSHGVVETPCFMPIATMGAVKTLSSQDVEALGAQILLSNTYHLMLRPGLEAMQKLGGLHAFMQWPHPLLTDSGGFQVFSLAKTRRIDDDGVTFRSHIDGSPHLMSPEKSMEVQRQLGSDIAMVLDHVVALPATHESLEDAFGERGIRPREVDADVIHLGAVPGDRAARGKADLDLGPARLAGAGEQPALDHGLDRTAQLTTILHQHIGKSI